MESVGCLVASAVFKTVEGGNPALVGSIPSLSAIASLSGASYLSSFRPCACIYFMMK